MPSGNNGNVRVWEQCPISDWLRFGFSEACRKDLAERWIGSMTEYLATLKTLLEMERPPRAIVELVKTCKNLHETVPENFNNTWTQLTSQCLEDRFLGLLGGEYDSFDHFSDERTSCRNPLEIKDPPGFDDLKCECFLPMQKYASIPFHNQGEGGSCVAFAIAEMFEYYTGKFIDDDEIENFYRRCQSQDGVNGAEGTSLQAAVALAGEKGLLLRQLNPGLVATMKKALSGGVGLKGNLSLEPSPIVATFTTHWSSVYSETTRRFSGKWTIPFPGEASSGSHAIVLVGYKDDENAPGGGYFVARNSWGRDYASQSPVAPGHALIPYSYAKEYCENAYFVEKVKSQPNGVGAAVPWAPRDEFEEQYAWRLTEPAIERYEDAKGVYRELRILAPNTVVVGRKDDPTYLRELSAATRDEFIRNGYAWSKEGRLRRYYPTPIDPATVAQASELQTMQHEFMNGLKANVERLALQKSTLSRGWATRPNFTVEERWNGRDELLKRVRETIAESLNAPGYLLDPQFAPGDYHSALDAAVAVNIWDVDHSKKDGGVKATVVGCFLAPLEASVGAVPSFSDPTPKLVDAVLTAIENQLAQGALDSEFLSVALGVPKGDPRSFVAATTSFDFVAVFIPRKHATIDARYWLGETADRKATDARYEPLRQALTPTTREFNAWKICAVVDDPGFLGFKTDKAIYKRLDEAVSLEEINETAEALVQSGKYAWETTRTNERAIKKL